jgi:hypothetical protein
MAFISFVVTFGTSDFNFFNIHLIFHLNSIPKDNGSFGINDSAADTIQKGFQSPTNRAWGELYQGISEFEISTFSPL